MLYHYTRVLYRHIIQCHDDTLVSNTESLHQWHVLQNYWSGGNINSLRARIAPDHQPGTGMAWITHDLHMVKGQPSTDFPHLIGMVDTANGIAPRQREKQAWAFPNIDLQIHKIGRASCRERV